MKDLRKMFLVGSLIGIFLIISIASLEKPPRKNIEDIEDGLLNRKIIIQGEIFNVRSYDDSEFQIISIRDDTGGIDVTTNKILELKSGQEIEVVGKVKEYREYLQIQADKIIIVS